MSARFVALLVTVVGLAACGSTGTTATTPESDAAPPPPQGRLVVRGPIVPDDDVTPVSAPAAKKTPKPAKRVALADGVSAPAVENPVVEKPLAEKPAPRKPQPSDTAIATPPAAGSSGSSGPGGGSTDTHSSSAAESDTGSPTTSMRDVTPVPLSQPVEPAPTVTAEPVSTPGAPKPSPFAVDFRDMLTTTIAGFPLWLMIVAGIALTAALVFGVGGSKRARPRQEPVREDRSYVERGDEEPVAV